jgi:hypothetical protein
MMSALIPVPCDGSKRESPPLTSAEGFPFLREHGQLDYFAGALAVGADMAVPVGVDVGAEAGAAGFGDSCFWHPANRDRAAIPRTIMTEIFFTIFTSFFLE